MSDGRFFIPVTSIWHFPLLMQGLIWPKKCPLRVPLPSPNALQRSHLLLLRLLPLAPHPLLT